jgi:hypothetical protein
VRRASRRAITALFVGLIAGLVALAIVGPTPSAPASTPADTFNHVDVNVSDAGFDVTPSTVPAGLVEVAMNDHRADTTHAIVVSSDLGTLVPGSQVVSWRVLGGHLLTVHDISGAFVFDRMIKVAVPQLASPTEPVNRITLDLRSDGVTAPSRDVRREQPYLPAFAASAPPNDRRWTAVASGRYQIALHNASSTEQQCSIDPVMRKRRVGAGTTASVGVGLQPNGPDGSHTYVLTCIGGGSTRQVDLWIS